jgi:hypothetical protein
MLRLLPDLRRYLKQIPASLDLFGVELKRNTFCFTRSFDGREEAPNQFIRTPELARHQFLCPVESMSMIVSNSPSDTMIVVIAHLSHRTAARRRRRYPI